MSCVYIEYIVYYGCRRICQGGNFFDYSSGNLNQCVLLDIDYSIDVCQDCIFVVDIDYKLFYCNRS